MTSPTAVAAPTPVPTPPQPRTNARNPTTLAWCSAIGIALVAVVLVWNIGHRIEGYDLGERVFAGSVSDAEIAAYDENTDTILGFGMIFFVPAAIVFLVWFHRSMKAAQELNLISKEHSTAWAIGSWFIPLVNIVAAPLALRRLVRATSTGDAIAQDLMVGGWALSIVVGLFVLILTEDATTPTAWERNSNLIVLGDVLFVVSAALLCALIRGVAIGLQDPDPLKRLSER